MIKPEIVNIDLEFFLRQIPLFSAIPLGQIRKVAACFKTLSLKKGQVVYRPEEPGDAMYIIRSGTVALSRRNRSPEAAANGRKAGHKELGRGDFFGETALLSDSPRAFQATVALDATLFRLSKSDFVDLLSSNREMGLYLSRLYARQIATGLSDPEHRPTTFYAVCASQGGLGSAHFLYSLAHHISTESTCRVLVVDTATDLSASCRQWQLSPSTRPSSLSDLAAAAEKPSEPDWYSHPAGFMVLQPAPEYHGGLASTLSGFMAALKGRYDIVLFGLGHAFGGLLAAAVRLSDKTLLLINNTEAGYDSVRRHLSRIESLAGPGLDRVRVGVSHLCGDRGIHRRALKQRLGLSQTPRIWVGRNSWSLAGKVDTRRGVPVQGPRALAREIAGVRVGLALGAGAARGWAHIGVLQVLQENGIQVDMISGTSMGALVGAIYAARASVAHLKKTTIDRFPTRALARKGIFDYTLPLKGMLRGNKAFHLVSHAVRQADFMDLKIPTYLTCVDLIRGEEVLLETGDVAKAVRSSLSLPVVFSPVRHMGRWMVDGGLLNPVPVNILEQKGADRIIAVCVEPPRLGSEGPGKAPGIMEVIARTMRIVHQRATGGFARKSDLVIYPEVQDFRWDDFHRGKELMQRGIQACKPLTAEIRKMAGPAYTGG